MAQDLTKLSNEELLDRTLRWAAKAGISGSGLCMDVMHGMNVKELKQHKEELLRRLNSAT
jgi:sugar phosphate isomerase/epimerase